MAQTSNGKLIDEAWAMCDEMHLPYLRLRRDVKGTLAPDFEWEREGLWFWSEDLHPCLTEISLLEMLIEHQLGRLSDNFQMFHVKRQEG